MANHFVSTLCTLIKNAVCKILVATYCEPVKRNVRTSCLYFRFRIVLRIHQTNGSRF